MAAAVLQLDGAVWGTTVICLGKTVTKFDAQLVAFQPALTLTNLFLQELNYTGEVLILNDIKVAVPKAVDTRPGPDQPSSLDTTWHIEHILHEHTNCSLRIAWGKRVVMKLQLKRVFKQRRELCRRLGVLLSPKGVFIHSMVYMCI